MDSQRTFASIDPKPEKYAGHKLREGAEVWFSAAA
jgi:hypothetical protein